MIAICLVSLFAASPQILLTAEDLAQNMNAWQIIDVRSAEDYANAHIPGARHFDPNALSETRNEVVGVLKPLDELTAILAEAGLDPKKPVIIYSAMQSAGDLKQATRLFWILEYLSYKHVALLDGGYAGWLRAGKPVVTQPTLSPSIAIEKLKLRPREDLLATRDEVARVIEKQDGVLIDNRSAEQYTGLSQSGAVAAPGHIDGARSVPVDTLLDAETFTFKQDDLLGEVTPVTSTKKKQPVITYCNTGRDATAGYFALRLQGHQNIAVYDGSMSEWSRLPQLQIQE